MNTKVCVAWHNRVQIEAFLTGWKISHSHPSLVLQQDVNREGCARTKNKALKRAIEGGAEIVIVCDDDCLSDHHSFDEFIAAHEAALEPQSVEMFAQVTDPPNRGTPYHNRSLTMPVAASVGQWTHIADRDACAQLVQGAEAPMKFRRNAIFGQYHAMSGMNIAFRAEWFPWCQLVDVPRFDDIWGALIWQREAYKRGHCFNLAGPLVRHSRQSNVWQNLRDEAVNLERNETIWQEIHALPEGMSHVEILEALRLTV